MWSLISEIRHFFHHLHHMLTNFNLSICHQLTASYQGRHVSHLAMNRMAAVWNKCHFTYWLDSDTFKVVPLLTSVATYHVRLISAFAQAVPWSIFLNGCSISNPFLTLIKGSSSLWSWLCIGCTRLVQSLVVLPFFRICLLSWRLMVFWCVQSPIIVCRFFFVMVTIFGRCVCLIPSGVGRTISHDLLIFSIIVVLSRILLHVDSY